MNKQKLYRVVIEARPLPAHPNYSALQFGWLSTWLSAESAGIAADSALRILEQLPYERVDDQMRIDDTSSYLGPPSAEAYAPDLVQLNGLAVCFHGCATGEEETWFLELSL